jgi:hypothetical protein
MPDRFWERCWTKMKTLTHRARVWAWRWHPHLLKPQLSQNPAVERPRPENGPKPHRWRKSTRIRTHITLRFATTSFPLHYSLVKCPRNFNGKIWQVSPIAVVSTASLATAQLEYVCLVFPLCFKSTRFWTSSARRTHLAVASSKTLAVYPCINWMTSVWIVALFT